MSQVTTRPLILFGGGLDSCALVLQFEHLSPVLMHFDYGQRAVLGELRAMHHYAEKFKLDCESVRLPPYLFKASPLTTGAVITDASKHGENYIPGRNMLFGALGFSYACRNALAPIMLGASPAPAESVFYDAKLDFASEFNTMCGIGYPDSVPRLLMPLVSGDREQYVAAALKRDPDLFKWSFTCYDSVNEHECRVCVHCQQKAVLATKLGAAY